MPNWCNNLLIVESGSESFDLDKFWASCRPGYPAEDATSAEKVVAALDPTIEEQEFSFEVLVPKPEGLGDGWLDWAIANWGTKWDVNDVFIRTEDQNSVRLLFSSAWSPPVAWFEKFVEKHPGWDASLVYAEQGNWFAGAVEFLDGELMITEAGEGEQYDFLTGYGVGEWWPPEEDEDF